MDPIEVVARHVAATAVRGLIDSAWENYPEIGEYDWEAVCVRAQELFSFPSRAEYARAYSLLQSRADV